MILVLVETDASGAVEVSRETITFARSLAGDEAIDAVLVGEAPAGMAQQLADYGIRQVHHAVGDAFTAYSGAAWAAAVQAAQSRLGSTMVLAAGTPRGNEILAHLAARSDVAMAANVISCQGVSPLVVTRQVVGGAVLEEMRLDQTPAVLSVAGHAVEPTPAPVAAAGELIEFTPEIAAADLVARVVSKDAPPPDLSGTLKSARVVVGAGRGVGSADGFGDVLELADVLGGTLGVSRVVTSLGWRPHHEQVGQTGSRISADLYVACGISGAIQHWTGCSGAKTILAINTDADAPMVTKAHYAVIGDLHEVVPAILDELKARRG